MVYRVIAFLWFFVVAWIINWALSKNVGAIPYNYFTHWNVIGLSVYFFTASLCSINYLYLNHVNEEHWYFKYRLWLAQLLQRTFDALGASALFITLVAFTLLNPEFEFWNVTVHFTTTIAVLIELTLNNVYSHSRNIIGLVMWMFVYVIFTWIIVPGTHPAHSSLLLLLYLVMINLTQPTSTLPLLDPSSLLSTLSLPLSPRTIPP